MAFYTSIYFRSYRFDKILLVIISWSYFFW